MNDRSEDFIPYWLQTGMPLLETVEMPGVMHPWEYPWPHKSTASFQEPETTMNQFATVIPEGLKLHRKSDFASDVVTELANRDRVKVLQRRPSPGGTMMAEVMVSRTKNGIQVGMVGWAWDGLLRVELPKPAPLPPPPDVPRKGVHARLRGLRCETAEECEPLQLGKYILIGLAVAIGLALLLSQLLPD